MTKDHRLFQTDAAAIQVRQLQFRRRTSAGIGAQQTGAEGRFSRFELISWWDQERLSKARVLVIGAGEMADETLRYLRDAGNPQIHVINRDSQRGQQLAQQCNGHYHPWPELWNQLVLADLTISTTSASEPLVSADKPEPLLVYVNAVLRSDGALSMGERELIASYVSGLNACRFCHGSHAIYAEAFGIDGSVGVNVSRNLDQAFVQVGCRRRLVQCVEQSRLGRSNIDAGDIETRNAAVDASDAFYPVARLAEMVGQRLARTAGRDPGAVGRAFPTDLRSGCQSSCFATVVR